MDVLKELFSSRTRARIVELFTSRPKERLYLREVARLIKADVRSVKQELDRLERLGLLKSEASGNRRYLTANLDFSLYPELKRLVLKTAGLAKTLKKTLQGLGGIQFAFVYGSLARDSENPESDLDLFIIGNVSGPTLHRALSEAKVALHREINTTRFSIKELLQRVARGDSFLGEVLRKRKVFLIGREADLKRTLTTQAA